MRALYMVFCNLEASDRVFWNKDLGGCGMPPGRTQDVSEPGQVA